MSVFSYIFSPFSLKSSSSMTIRKVFLYSVILNNNFYSFDKESKGNALFNSLLDDSDNQIYIADGGFNVLSNIRKDLVLKAKGIIGDMDSVNIPQIENLNYRKLEYIHSSCQNTNDLEKSLNYIIETIENTQKSTKIPINTYNNSQVNPLFNDDILKNLIYNYILVYGSSGGRFDHSLSSININYIYSKRSLPKANSIIFNISNETYSFSLIKSTCLILHKEEKKVKFGFSVFLNRKNEENEEFDLSKDIVDVYFNEKLVFSVKNTDCFKFYEYILDFEKLFLSINDKNEEFNLIFIRLSDEMLNKSIYISISN